MGGPALEILVARGKLHGGRLAGPEILAFRGPEFGAARQVDFHPHGAHGPFRRVLHSADEGGALFVEGEGQPDPAPRGVPAVRAADILARFLTLLATFTMLVTLGVLAAFSLLPTFPTFAVFALTALATLIVLAALATLGMFTSLIPFGLSTSRLHLFAGFELPALFSVPGVRRLFGCASAAAHAEEGKRNDDRRRRCRNSVSHLIDLSEGWYNAALRLAGEVRGHPESTTTPPRPTGLAPYGAPETAFNLAVTSSSSARTITSTTSSICSSVITSGGSTRITVVPAGSVSTPAVPRAST